MFADDEEMWKSICKSKRRGDFFFQGTWKRATLFSRNQLKSNPPPPLLVDPLISIDLYEKWYRGNIPLDQWNQLPIQQVERRNNLSLEEFIKEYDSKMIPVIITDAMNSWKAKDWTKEYFLQKFGSFPFKTDEPDIIKRQKLFIKMQDYLEYFDNNNDEDPIYLFDDKLAERDEVKEILNDWAPPIYFQEDYFKALEEERPPYRWIVMGPKRSGSPFHTDPYRTSAWNGLIKGRKRWVLYPYNLIPPGVDVDFDEDGNFESDSPEPVKWFLENYPFIPEKYKPIECILEEGEIIFIPSGWWHLVINLTDTIAVTQNFCNQSNFDIVCAELNFDDEELYEDFQTRLTKIKTDISFPTNLVESGFRT
eukprot:TRINITY_DN71_c1_g1_i4.p1 TRINITY_DN71_c1_g1~~TRINITY_DN71_c1_g1_i4.p1  ORF type:complete len:365 (+),score=71.86 TRINITY_DN71_c1_g1_i4:490-1584(+)